MIDPAMQRARELAAAECLPYDVARYMNGEADDEPALIALAKRERAFSDAVVAYCGSGRGAMALVQFILPPAKPDPVNVLADALYDRVLSRGDSIREALRSELELAGLELREAGE